MRLLIISSFLLTVCTLANAQQNYDASLIPKELLPYASAIIRDKEENVEVNSLNNTTYHIKEAITVLNKNGDNIAQMVVEHDKSTIIKYIKGAVYNAFGKQIGKFSESDFDDVSAGHDFSLFEDVRLKHYLPAVTEYPYTLVYEYEQRLKQSLDFPQWEPVDQFGVAVEKSSFQFTCSPDFNIRYKEINFVGKVDIGKSPKGLKTYTWRLDNLKAKKYEPLSPYYKNYMTSVQIAPEKFSYYGVNGSFTNWKELGQWEYDKLLSTRRELPEETVAHMREITKDIPDLKLKAKKIYEYMQDKTHYISVQVGIGGQQPFLASDVDKQNYGDCKALVNYTQALLNAVGIESYYCVVKSGEFYKVSMLKDFASMEQGDHIILCMPFKNDTTWAECTNQTIPFGYLGGFTDDRIVLACTPEGGKLMRTPKYTAENNLESRNANFTINTDGSLDGSMSTTFKGTNYFDASYLVDESRGEQYKIIKKKYTINNMDIRQLDLKCVKSADPVYTENIKLHARDYASLADGKIFFMLNSFDRSGGPPPQVRNRVNDVYINRGNTQEDEITYTIPAGYHLEKTPLNYSVNKPFGSFSASMTLVGDKLTYKRKFQLTEGTFSKDVYSDLVDFYQLAYDADDYTVSLVKN
jgi:transglutaminase-like putative cysteine protease